VTVPATAPQKHTAPGDDLRCASGTEIITPLVIFLRRIPMLFILKPFVRSFSSKDILFMGWFGPVGVAALFYITLLLTKYPGHEQLWPIVAYAVVFSSFIHAITANTFSLHPVQSNWHGSYSAPSPGRRFSSAWMHLLRQRNGMPFRPREYPGAPK
jgi:hypothetical protein